MVRERGGGQRRKGVKSLVIQSRLSCVTEANNNSHAQDEDKDDIYVRRRLREIFESDDLDRGFLGFEVKEEHVSVTSDKSKQFTSACSACWMTCKGT